MALGFSTMRDTEWKTGFQFLKVPIQVLPCLATMRKKNLNLLSKSCNNVSFFRGDIYLEMIKNEEASGFYDDGLAFLFKDEDGNPKDVKPYHIHVEIQTGSPDVESCDLRLYSVEVSDETEEEKTTQTICKGSDDFATGGGPNIEGQGANPEKDPASPPRANDSRLLQAVKENEEGDETGENSEESD